MNQFSSRVVPNALRHINETYGFLLDRGYAVYSAEAVPTGWQVVLRKRDLYLKILELRGEEELYFGAGSQPPEEFTDMGTVIFAAAGARVPRWESSDIKMLERYLDRIETYFEGEYVRNRHGLRTAGREYAAAFSQGGVAAPPQPKMIPLLHYPLMGIIILLLFGALTTLYMVLLTVLFSVFSLDRDSGGIFIGVVALILAAGTMLLFRALRRRS